MKRLVCALTLLVLTCSPALAEFKGTLQRDQPWMLEIHAASPAPVAVTIYYLGKTLDPDVIPPMPSGATVQLPDLKIPRSTRRIIIEVDLAIDQSNPQGLAEIRVVQGATSYTSDLGTLGTGESLKEGETFRLVFDVP